MAQPGPRFFKVWPSLVFLKSLAKHWFGMWSPGPLVSSPSRQLLGPSHCFSFEFFEMRDVW